MTFTLIYNILLILVYSIVVQFGLHVLLGIEDRRRRLELGWLANIPFVLLLIVVSRA